MRIVEMFDVSEIYSDVRVYDAASGAYLGTFPTRAVALVMLEERFGECFEEVKNV